MDWNAFFKSIKSGIFENVYLFAGPEAYTKKEALDTLRQAVLPPGLEALNEVTLENCSAQTIIDSAETLPVMCERRIVVVRDWNPLKAGAGKSEDADVERMLEWLKDIPESSILVFYMSVEIDGRKKLAAALKKRKGYVEFNRLSGSVLLKWCNQQLRADAKRLTQDAFNQLVLMAGQDLVRLSGELKKLSAYTESADEIRTEDVCAVVSPSTEYSVFMILEHLLTGQLVQATQVVNRVLQAEPGIPRLISMLASQLRLDAHMKYCVERGGNMTELLKVLNVNEYRSRHILRQIRPLKAADLERLYLRCVETDYAIKSGRLRDRAALDRLMIEIAMDGEATKSAALASKG